MDGRIDCYFCFTSFLPFASGEFKLSCHLLAVFVVYSLESKMQAGAVLSL